jgi:hypothetical protein
MQTFNTRLAAGDAYRRIERQTKGRMWQTMFLGNFPRKVSTQKTPRSLAVPPLEALP